MSETPATYTTGDLSPSAAPACTTCGDLLAYHQTVWRFDAQRLCGDCAIAYAEQLRSALIQAIRDKYRRVDLRDDELADILRDEFGIGVAG